jgi:hypothetical protein
MDLSAYGEIALPSGHAELAFQMDINPSESPDAIWFGLIAADENPHEIKAGMAVRIDLARGEVWDALNGMGLLGTLELGPLGLGRYDEHETLLIRLKVEKFGQNLIPTLHIGDDVCLYPAISADSLQQTPLMAVAGAVQPGRDAEPFCHYPAFWLRQAA